MPETKNSQSDIHEAISQLARQAQGYATHDDLSRVEENFGRRVEKLEVKIDDGFEKLARDKQPITAFAGWASVLLVIIGAILWPMLQQDAKHSLSLKELKAEQVADAFARGVLTQRTNHIEDEQGRQDGQIIALRVNELRDAETRGTFEERFRTLDEAIKAAVVNRADKHDQLSLKLDGLSKELDTVRAQASHEINNGMGQRIEEKTNDLRADIEWLKAMLGATSK